MDDREAIVREVFARVRAQDETVVDLYADDASVSVEDTVHRGRDRIREFYRGLFRDDPPQPEVQEVFSQGDLFVALLSVRRQSGGPARPVADAFTVVDGKIAALRICIIGGRL
jgi:ketosteroid isomerase-like protein